MRVKRRFFEENIGLIVEVSYVIAERLKNGNKLILFGNGGSASDASHIAAEFVNRYRMERGALGAIALNTDMSVITSIANDYDYANIFSRQIEALAKKGDVAIGISTSGSSLNVLKAVETAKEKELITIAFTSERGELLSKKVDYAFKIPSKETPRIQETHITLAHILCQNVEELLFKK
ncbi:MAG: SIS domain-containing protein [Nitrospirae bacterium]|nr:MAG: SIS domain-containing protein [Nitrospirota bacterium]